MNEAQISIFILILLGSAAVITAAFRLKEKE